MHAFFVITHAGVWEFTLIELEPQTKRSIACYSIALCGCLKCSFSSSGSFGFCQTFELFAGWYLISYDRV